MIPPRLPYDFAHSAQVLTDPALHGGMVSVIQDRWQHLKESRGQFVDLERLAEVHHLIEPGPARPLPEGSIDAARHHAIPRIREAIASHFRRRSIDPDGGGEAA